MARILGWEDNTIKNLRMFQKHIISDGELVLFVLFSIEEIS